MDDSFVYEVIILGRTPLNKTFYYYSKENIISGTFVEVLFNKRIVFALVLSQNKKKNHKKLNEIQNIIKGKAFCETTLNILKQLKNKYFVSYAKIIEYFYGKNYSGLPLEEQNPNGNNYEKFFIKGNIDINSVAFKEFLKFLKYKNIIIVCPNQLAFDNLNFLLKDFSNKHLNKIVIITKKEIKEIFKDYAAIMLFDATNYLHNISEFNIFKTYDILDFYAKEKNIPIFIHSEEFNIFFYKQYLEKKLKLLDFTYFPDSLDVLSINMNKEAEMGNFMVFSCKLLDVLNENLRNGKKTLLLHHFKDYSKFISCRSCGKVLKCISCESNLSYIKKNNILICRCKKKHVFNELCPKCGGKDFLMQLSGLEQYEEKLKELFFEAKIKIADTRRNILNADIILSTNFELAKEDFSAVCLLSADFYNNIKEYDSNEQAFLDIRKIINSLKEKNNEKLKFIIQGYELNSGIEFAINDDFEGFYEEEISNRRSSKLWPFSESLTLFLRGKNIMDEALKFFFLLKKDLLLQVLRPNYCLEDKTKVQLKIAYPLIYDIEEKIKRVTDEFPGLVVTLRKD